LKPDRRRFLGVALAGLWPKTDRPISGSFVNESDRAGHRLRSRGPFAAPKCRVPVPVVIVGAGMAGLSAAWRLDKRGFRDFVLLEMEKQAGGVSRWGENEITAYPWGASGAHPSTRARDSARARQAACATGLACPGLASRV